MTIEKAKIFFFNLHDVDCNQKYGYGQPYSYHLDKVADVAKRFEHLIINTQYYIPTWVGIYGHDSIEDARVTYSNIKEQFGYDAAEIIFLCTEDKGRNRKERKSEKWYNKLKTNKYAVFVKLCDMIANGEYSQLTQSSMYGKYKNEYINTVRPILYIEEYKEIFDYMDVLFKVK